MDGKEIWREPRQERLRGVGRRREAGERETEIE
jgi:hypothetical protein